MSEEIDDEFEAVKDDQAPEVPARRLRRPQTEEDGWAPPGEDNMAEEAQFEHFQSLINQVAQEMPKPVRFYEMDNEELRRVISELNEWVRWLVEEFKIPSKEIPPCWYKHHAVLEELQALYSLYLVNFHEAQSAAASIQFMVNLSMSRPRLAEWISHTGCTVRDHKPSGPYAGIWPDTYTNDLVAFLIGLEHPDTTEAIVPVAPDAKL